MRTERAGCTAQNQAALAPSPGSLYGCAANTSSWLSTLVFSVDLEDFHSTEDPPLPPLPPQTRIYQDEE